MDYAIAALSGVFFVAAIYLLLARSLIRMLLGLALIGNAVNLLILVAGRLTRVVPPIALGHADTPAAGAANPLPQALILTAIVIGFGVTAYLVMLLYRMFLDHKTTNAAEMYADQLHEEDEE